MVKLTGGGIQGNKVKQSRSGYKVNPVANKASPAGAGQLGAAVQFRKEPLIQQGKGYNPPGVGDTGITNARQGPAGAGPGGGGRTIYAHGSQAMHGKPAQGVVNKAPDVPASAPTRDILSQFGPEVKGR
jgi:hypothetical protein